MPTQKHTIDIEFDGEGYVARLEPSLRGIETSFSSPESFPVFDAVLNWLKVLEPDRNRSSRDDGRLIVLRVHRSALRGRDEGWGLLVGITSWPSRSLIVDDDRNERHYLPAIGGQPVIVKLLEQLGGLATLAELTQAKTEDGDTIWNHVGGGQYPEDLLGLLGRTGVITYDDRTSIITLLDTDGNPVKS